MTRTADTEILARLTKSLVTVGAQRREVVEVGPFQACLSPDSDEYLMSFAAPSGRAPGDWGDAIAALQEAFSARDRVLRLEFFEELYPTLGPALEQAGIRKEKTAPALVLEREKLRPQLKATGGTYVNVTPDLMERFLIEQNRAYGMDPESALAWRPTLEEGLANGTVLMAATVAQGEPRCGATILIGGDAGELCGVWTAPEARRQGLGGDVCSRLLMDYFVLGHELAWLSAGGDSWALYRKLGFVPVGTQLNYGRRST